MNYCSTFFATLGGDYFHFQTFADKKGSENLTSTFQGVSIPKALKGMNEDGAGIFVAINEHEAGKPRTKKTTTKIRAIFADFDDIETAADKVKEISAVLEPSMVVESSPGKFHVYYVLQFAGQIPIEEFRSWQQHLVKNYNSDPKCVDSSRVMRVPGYLHQKGEPFNTRIVSNSKRKYFVDDLISAFYGGRNNYFTSVAGRFRHAGLPQAQILEKLQALNVLLQNQLDEEELERVAKNIDTYAPDPKRAKEYENGKTAEELDLETNKNGRVLATYGNTLKLFAHFKWVRFNIFANCPEVVMPVPWARNSQTDAWTDSDTIGAMSYLTRVFGSDWSRNHTDAAVDNLSASYRYDPLVDYLTSLEWDGTPRLESVFTRHLGAPEDNYHSAVARHFFINAVRRALEPGCKCDSVLVLVGEEGTGKSSFASLLSPVNDWYTDSIGDMKYKDAVINLHGKWIVELSELRSMQGVSSEHTKAFLSAQVDNIRLPYDRRSTAHKRRCIFIGTTNNDKFLTDSGANRRFFPVETAGRIDRKAFRAEVPQLWAEAVRMYKDKVNTTVPPSLLGKRRLESSEDGGYVADVVRYVNNSEDSHFVPRDFYLEMVEGASKEKWTNDYVVHKRIANAAKIVFNMPENSGWKYGIFRVNGITTRCWKKE